MLFLILRYSDAIDRSSLKAICLRQSITPQQSLVVDVYWLPNSIAHLTPTRNVDFRFDVVVYREESGVRLGFGPVDKLLSVKVLFAHGLGGKNGLKWGGGGGGGEQWGNVVKG